ncbi:hypothetical protein CW740_01630 [Kangiella profundi]|uniref:Uncharacterized protein n=1 Tax=Kangiella profundi TaxID=1561924 RepID=A0A2K9AVU4_9GAMM|nr:cyclase family protein [Kangiella profundi]AUD78009.1 hypothetical protein CW740_01630 [Kangiella profundi]GGE90667.1 hypothetical protein GCM10011356_01010 [Kangiella profundi]
MSKFNLTTEFMGKRYTVDTEHPYSIAIALDFDGKQPNHFGAESATRQPLQAGSFVGDTTQGGSCNVDSIQLVPHCNGTHTESVHHICDQTVSVGTIFNNSLSIACLISIEPKLAEETNDSYRPSLEGTDKVIDKSLLQSALSNETLNNIESLVVRCVPNHAVKKSCRYDETNQPPFFTREAMELLAASNIKHLLVDFPSVDKMYDDGHLTNHHIYWNLEADSHQLTEQARCDRTITEMVFVPDEINDGIYCLNLQIPAFELDAAPSRPILYPLIDCSDQ